MEYIAETLLCGGRGDVEGVETLAGNKHGLGRLLEHLRFVLAQQDGGGDFDFAGG